MPGRPLFKIICATIEEYGGEEWVLEQIMDGRTLAQVCDVMDCSRGMVYQWLHKDEERWTAYNAAKMIGAHAMVEDAFEILENATPDTIVVDRERAKIRQWIAERANRKDFGSEKGQQVTAVMNISELHLVAVQSAPKDHPPVEEIEDAEVIEVIDDQQPMRLKA